MSGPGSLGRVWLLTTPSRAGLEMARTPMQLVEGRDPTNRGCPSALLGLAGFGMAAELPACWRTQGACALLDSVWGGGAGSPIFLPCNCPCCLQCWEQRSCCLPASSCHDFEVGELTPKREAALWQRCTLLCWQRHVWKGVGARRAGGEEMPSATLGLSILPSCVLLIFLLRLGP